MLDKEINYYVRYNIVISVDVPGGVLNLPGSSVSLIGGTNRRGDVA